MLPYRHSILKIVVALKVEVELESVKAAKVNAKTNMSPVVIMDADWVASLLIK